MTPAVSILVPIYNVSNFIERCAHSLFQQTFDDIEYVFVNDCTPDDSVEKLQKVMEQYPNRKERIKIIHHEKNRGLAAARNTAIDNSTGKYIQHIDSDDWIELDMIETMYKKAEIEQADIVVSDIILEQNKHQIILTDIVVKNKEDNFRNMLVNKISYCSLVNKFVRKELYQLPDCRSVEGLNYAEDFYVSVRLYYHARKIAKIDKVFYHYDKTNENSITRNKSKTHFENVILFWKLLDDFLKEKQVYENYIEITEKGKLRLKIQLFFDTKEIALRYEYREMFAQEEKKYYKSLKFVEKTMFFCARRKYLLWITQIIRTLLIIKSKFHYRIPKIL